MKWVIASKVGRHHLYRLLQCHHLERLIIQYHQNATPTEVECASDRPVMIAHSARLGKGCPDLVVLDDASAELESTWVDNKDHVDVIAAADDAAIVRQALAMLSPAERAALVMWEMEGRSTSEIAAELGIKESAVRHTVSRARASLRRVMSELIVDSERGLTALDMLSTTYKKAASVAKKSSKAALSLILVFFAS